jgi:hypothetical protein
MEMSFDDRGIFNVLPFPVPVFQLGLMWNLTEIFLLRLEIGFPCVFRFGLGFGF